MVTFDELTASRRKWIEDVLEPWCRAASLGELKKAFAEWGDIAGRVDAEATLWTWAWSRFPELVHEGLAGVNEADGVGVTLKDGREMVGVPDARRSEPGKLLLIPSSPGDDTEPAPVSIDAIRSVAKTNGGNHTGSG